MMHWLCITLSWSPRFNVQLHLQSSCCLVFLFSLSFAFSLCFSPSLFLSLPLCCCGWADECEGNEAGKLTRQVTEGRNARCHGNQSAFFRWTVQVQKERLSHCHSRTRELKLKLNTNTLICRHSVLNYLTIKEKRDLLKAPYCSLVHVVLRWYLILYMTLRKDRIKTTNSMVTGESAIMKAVFKQWANNVRMSKLTNNQG